MGIPLLYFALRAGGTRYAFSSRVAWEENAYRVPSSVFIQLD